MTNILLVEDHSLVRTGIRLLLETDEENKVVGETANGKEAIAFMSATNDIDIVLTDMVMPEMDAISLIGQIKALRPEVKVVVLTMYENENYLKSAFLQGASGYLLKTVTAEELLFALKFIERGGQYLCSGLAVKIINNWIEKKQYLPLDNELHDGFNQQEIEVLQLIAEGLTNTQIAERLEVSKRTVEGHRQSLIEKTSSKNTASLIRYAVLNRLIV